MSNPRDASRQHYVDKAKALGKWLHVEDMAGNGYDIYLSDITGKDEWDFLVQTNHQMGGLCDLFLEGKVTLVNIAGLIWTARRRYERKLTVQDVLKTVSMSCIETMELHDPEDEDEEPAPDDPAAKLAQIRAGEGPLGFDDRSDTPGPGSGPSTE